MTRSYHLSLDLRGALLNWTNRELVNAIRHDDGRRMTAREARLALMDEIAKGRKVIPCGPCNNFDYQSGCLGHEVRPAATGTDSVPRSVEPPDVGEAFPKEADQ